MLLIKNNQVIRDDENKVIPNIKNLEERLKNHKNSEIRLSFSLLKDYMEVEAIKDGKVTFIGLFDNTTITSNKAIKSFLRTNGFKCYQYGSIKF